MRRGLVLSLVVAVAWSAGAQVYRWVDKDGKVHYSDTKPPVDAKAKTEMTIVTTPTPPDADAAAAAASDEQTKHLEEVGAAPDTTAMDQRKAAADAAAAKADHDRQCTDAVARLSKLENSRRVVSKDANGNDVYESGEDLVAKREQAKAEVAKLCE